MAVPSASPRRLDVHCHYAPPIWTTVVAEKTTRGLFGRERPAEHIKDWTAAATIEQMDRAEITTSILSLTTPGIWFGAAESPIDATRRLARACNEHGATLVADYRGRFGLFAALPLPDIDGSLREIEYALDTLNVDGLGLLSHYGETYGDRLLGDPMFAPVFEELNRRKAVVYVHRKIASTPYEIMGWDLHRAMLSLCSFGPDSGPGSGGAPRYPDIKFIFSHAGGTMPFLIERSTAPTKARNPPAAENPTLNLLRHFHYDTGHSNNARTLAALKHVVPASQIMFGTDFPYSDLAAEVRGLAESGVFSAAVLAAVSRDNALALLPKRRP